MELQKGQSLFARMMVVCQVHLEINIAEVIGKYELTVVPRMLFSTDDTMLHCLQKSAFDVPDWRGDTCEHS